ncbi:MFS transporter [Cardiobacteriaceae bacterium TAE3-ERU3]|nr:MFS transporter [Cardiobacteriaceae bacterium TAE3-ERU3]
MKRLLPLFAANGLVMAAMFAFVPLAGPLIRALSLKEWHAGVIVAVASLLWMIAAPVWGQISDRRGRRPIIIAGAVGFAISYVLLALWLQINLDALQPLWLLLGIFIVLRVLSGVFIAAVSVGAIAYIADVTTPAQRTSAMALIGMAAGLGITLGPAISGALAVYGLVVPMFAVSALPLLAVVLVLFWLPPSPKLTHEDLPPLSAFDPRIFATTVKMFLTTSTSITANMVVGFYAIDRLELDVQAATVVAGYAMTAVGVTMIAVQMVMMRLPQVKPWQWQRYGALLGALGFVAVLFVHTSSGFILSYALMAAGICVIFPSLHAEVTMAVEKGEVGAAAGRLSAAEALAAVVVPLLATGMYGVSPLLPYIMALLAALAVSALSWRKMTQ